ncbi:MAG: hypothetical protein AAB888_00500, partial [Patescibacteria group bacterium]
MEDEAQATDGVMVSVIEPVLVMVRLDEDEPQVPDEVKAPLLGLTVKVLRSDEVMLILEPDCRTTSKLLAPTTIDSTVALDPDIFRLVDATLITVSVVSVTSLNAAKL